MIRRLWVKQPLTNVIRFTLAHLLILILGQGLMILAGIEFTRMVLQDMRVKKFENQTEILVNGLQSELNERAILASQWSDENLLKKTRGEPPRRTGELLKYFNKDPVIYSVGTEAGALLELPEGVMEAVRNPKKVVIKAVKNAKKTVAFSKCLPKSPISMACSYFEAVLALQSYAMRDPTLRIFRIDLLDTEGKVLVEFFPYTPPFLNETAAYPAAVIQEAKEVPMVLDILRKDVFIVKRAIPQTNYQVVVSAPVQIFESKPKETLYVLILIVLSLAIAAINFEFFRRKIFIPSLEIKKYEQMISKELRDEESHLYENTDFNLIRQSFESLYAKIQAFKGKQEGFQNALKEEIRRLEQEQKKTTLQLIQAEKMSVISRLMAGVAHEIKNPLTSIKLAVDTLKLQADRLPTNSVGYIYMISEEISRLSNMLNRFLGLGKPHADSKKIQCQVNDIVKNAVKLLESDMAQKAITLNLELDAAVVPQNWIFDEMLSAFVNLLKNSVEAVEPHGRINIISVEDPSGVWVKFEDSGPGIPEEMREKVFDVFFTTKPSGTGLGMPQVLQAVILHHGEITITSSSLGGASINMFFPKRME